MLGRQIAALSQPPKLCYKTEESSPTSLELFERTTHSSSHSKYGNRRRKRPPTRRLDNAKKNLKLMRIQRWMAIVTDRVNWIRISESALACKKLLSL
ncbi:hypothetical protein TNCV_568441 [Trichonephila clavipes]|nr:hypothetical protein TNCV_568441 [Trichonephila clavipes]